MTMFKVGDKVRVTEACAYDRDSVPLGWETEVSGLESDGKCPYPYECKVPFGALYVFAPDELELVEKKVETVEEDITFPNGLTESYTLTYTETDENGETNVTSTVKGDGAGDLKVVLGVVRDFLVKSGFNYIHELNAVTETGEWHSSN